MMTEIDLIKHQLLEKKSTTSTNVSPSKIQMKAAKTAAYRRKVSIKIQIFGLYYSSQKWQAEMGLGMEITQGGVPDPSHISALS